MHERTERRGMLEREPPPRPPPHHPRELVSDLGRIVVRQPDDRQVEGGEGRGRVEVAAFPRLLDERQSSGP